jgi:hypothetical protein
MSAEIILPARHHFNAEPALQAPKTSSAFQPCANFSFCLFPLVLTTVGWLLKQLMRILPGPVTEWLINRSTERIRKAANAICLKDYSSFLKSKEAPA